MPCRCLAVLLILAAAATIVATTATAFASSSDDAVGRPEAVLVLGGGAGERYARGRELATEHGVPLLLSWSAIAEAAAQGTSCEDPDVRCLFPDPLTTHGEARLLRDLVAAEGLGPVTVVTSRFHVGRSRVLMRQCLAEQVGVVGADTDATWGSQLYRQVREAYATVAALTVRRAC